MLHLGERATFIGQTGSGKSFAMLQILDTFYEVRQIEGFDGKADPLFSGLDVPRRNSLAAIATLKYPKYPMVIWRPNPEALAEPEVLDKWNQWIYRRKHTVAAIDEITLMTQSNKPPLGLLSLLARGRSRDITVLIGTQRPRQIPMICFTEATEIFCFRLTDKNDRKRVAEFTHPDMEIPVQDPHGFWHFRVGDDEATYYQDISIYLEEAN